MLIFLFLQNKSVLVISSMNALKNIIAWGIKEVLASVFKFKALQPDNQDPKATLSGNYNEKEFKYN